MLNDAPESLHCLIYEETPDAGRWLKQGLHGLSPGQVVRVVDELGLFEQRLREEDYNLVFLVVNELTINDFLFLQQLDFCPPFFVCSSNRAVAADAYGLGAAGFLSGDLPPKHLSQQIGAVLAKNALSSGNRHKAPAVPFIFVKSDYKFIRLNFDDILFVEGLGEYLRIYTDSAKHVVLQSFSRLMEVLPAQQFLRIHRSYLVNLHKINFIQNNVVSVGNHQLPISKSQKKSFFELIEQVGLF
ncbi:LytTR family DNA-binding domain-containing protein [Larkinella knui]|uniref:LytTR family transcriptional regulator n=1 Tax=Larkinella knui TaxID=2025310 RepID=A0A3P1CQ99_9BACT|nr:response regulator transcription factor [Larkinella knui]RRB15134.1 LytTR family transcriptional regulator [Larkinella knui]